MNYTSQFYAWLAGILEGEGNFQAHGTSYPQIKLAMTDADIVARVADAFGRRYYCKKRPTRFPHWKPCYVVSICGRDAIGIMMTIYPMMGARRSAKIRELLALWIQPRPRHNYNRDKTACIHGHPFTPENLYIRREGNGSRMCRTCRRLQMQRVATRRKAERAARRMVA